MSDNTWAAVVVWMILLIVLGLLGLFHENPTYWAIAMFGGALVLLVVLLASKGWQNELPRPGWPRLLARKSNPAPRRGSTKVKGKKAMLRATKEAIGKTASVIGIVTSYVMPVAYGIMFVAKDTAETVQIPLLSVDLFTFVQLWLPVLFWVWAGSNALAGRWAPETLVKNDRFSSLVAFLAIAGVAGYKLVIGEVPIETSLYGWFGIIPIAAFIDWWFAKSDNFRSSTLTRQNAALSAENERLTAELATARAQMAQFQPFLPTVTARGPGPFIDFARRLGSTPLNPVRIPLELEDNPRLVLLPDGYPEMDADLSEERQVELFTAELARKAAPAIP